MARIVCTECKYMHQQYLSLSQVQMRCGLAENAVIKMFRKKRPDWCPLLEGNIKVAGKQYKYELEREQEQADAEEKDKQ